MDSHDLHQSLHEKFAYHSNKLSEIRAEIDKIEALQAAADQRDTVGKCFVNYYGDLPGEGISFMTITRVEWFDEYGRAKGTSVTLSNNGHFALESDMDIWHANKNFEAIGGDTEYHPLPESVFEYIAKEVSEEIELELKEFLKGIFEWKTKRRDLITNFWTRIQQALSSTDLKLKPSETEK